MSIKYFNILILLLITQKILLIKIITVDEAFELIKKEKFSVKESITIIQYLSSIIKNYYIYTEIATNPPQPKFDQNYHEKFNITEKFNLIQNSITHEISKYGLYQKISDALSSFKDQHIYIKFPGIFKYFSIISPINLYMKTVNNITKIYGSSIYGDYFKTFNPDIQNIIYKNLNEPIKSINNKTVFEFITNFCNKYMDNKNHHGSFTFKLKNHNGVFLNFCPLNQTDLKKFEVIYENGDSFKTEYLIVNSFEEGKNSENGDFNKFADTIINNRFQIIPFYTFDFIAKKYNNKKFGFINMINNYNNFNYINWDYYYSDVIYCKSDKINEINLLKINSYSFDVEDDANNFKYYKELFKYILKLKKCFDLFDTNNYPIILIDEFNGGGKGYLSHLVLELLSPLFTNNYYFNIKKNFNFSIYRTLSSFSKKTCESLNYKIFDKYNDKNSIYTPKFILENEIKLISKNLKSKMKNKRKPTEIIVYTDGYSFSASALLMKNLKNEGGAILLGYLGDPTNINKKIFDAGQSPSGIINHYTLYNYGPIEYKKLFNEFNISLILPFMQMFFISENISNIPLEYLVTPIDEHSEIFENLNENNYDLFINKAKNIIEKYKIFCNINNKNLLKITKNCDGKFENNYTHGGYECGSDGKWSNKCIPAFCDEGYIFNHIDKKCVIDYCYDKAKYEFIFKYGITGIGFIFSFIYSAISLLVQCFCICCCKKNEEDEDENDEQELKFINE